MADFNNLALTVKGVKALLEAQTGTALTLSKIGMGSGFTTNSTSLTGLVTPEVMLPISSKKIDSELGFLTVTARITNEDITEGFYWRETGLFFEDSDGNDILFAYSCVDTKYDYVPAYSDRRYVKHIRIADIITDKADIEVKETAGLMYVDTLTFNEFQEEFKSHDHDDLYYSKNEVNAIRNALETLINAKPSTLAALGITASATELNYMDGVTSGVQGQLDKKIESLSSLGITATAAELNYMDGVTSGVQGQLDANESRADRFFPDSAMHNLVTDCLQINTVEDWTSNSGNRDSVIATEDVSTIVNSPISSGAFYAYREIRQVGRAGHNPKTIVTLKEAYPIGGREWSRAYNPDTGSWDEQWNCHDSACSHRDLGKSITDIVTNEIVYVCTPDRSTTKPICASEFTTGDGHKLTNKANQTDLDGINPFKGVFDSGNIDELMTYGVYWVHLNQNSTTITGTIPPYVNTQFGYFEVIKAYKAGTDCMQRFTEYFGGVVHTRVYVNGGWLDWETYNLNDYLPLSGGTLSGKLLISAGGLSINGNSNYLNLNDDSGTSRIQLWVDNEGGNLKIYSPDSYASNWEIDAFNGNLRIRDTVGGNTYVFKSVANGGTGGTFASAAFKSCQDSSSAGTLSSSGTNLCTERDIYYGLPTINGSHTYTSSTNIYAPTSVGTNGYVLVSNGSGAPSWKDLGSVSSSIGTFTYGSDATYFTSGNSSVSIKKHGKVVTISGYIYGINNGSTNDVEFTVGTVPSGFRPPSNVYGLAWHASSGNTTLKMYKGSVPFIINSSGVMTMQAVQTTYSGTRMHFTVTYVIS